MPDHAQLSKRLGELGMVNHIAADDYGVEVFFRAGHTDHALRFGAMLDDAEVKYAPGVEISRDRLGDVLSSLRDDI